LCVCVAACGWGSVTGFVSLPQPTSTRASSAAAQARRGMGATLHQSRKTARDSNKGPILPIGRAMRWLKHMLTVGLLIAAGVLALATVFSNHDSEFGKVALPSDEIVHLPKGATTVFYSGDGSDVEQQGTGLAFQVVPIAGGDPIPMSSAGG